MHTNTGAQTLLRLLLLLLLVWGLSSVPLLSTLLLLCAGLPTCCAALLPLQGVHHVGQHDTVVLPSWRCVQRIPPMWPTHVLHVPGRGPNHLVLLVL